jgi:hypothetical protein
MGFLSFLFGEKSPSNVDQGPDMIWLTTAAKYQGVRRELLQKSMSRSAAILLISHFSDVHDELNSIVEGYAGEVPVLVVRASDLSSRIAGGFAADENTVIDIIVAERHPLLSEDDRVLSSFADDLPCRCRVSYHVSLEDALMNLFAGESVIAMLRKLGMSDNEAIESRMVQKRVQQAQKKITARVSGNRPAATARQWLELNTD